MEKMLEIEIFSPESRVFAGRAKTVTIPGVDGLFQVLFNHAPVISLFETGVIIVEDENSEKINFATRGGVAEVLNNKVTILADAAETKEMIDTERAEKSMKRAEERLTGTDKVDRERAKFSMKRAKIRLKVAGVLK